MNSRSGIVSLVLLSATCLAACTSLTPVAPQSMPYFIGMQQVTVDDDAYLDRCACANGQPLVCQRTSRVLGSSLCRCH
mgnify:CR=1 FL=1